MVVFWCMDLSEKAWCYCDSLPHPCEMLKSTSHTQACASSAWIRDNLLTIMWKRRGKQSNAIENIFGEGSFNSTLKE